MTEGSTTATGTQFDISTGDAEPMQSTSHFFDSTMGLPDDSNWLDRKVLRRELTANRDKDSLTNRAERATNAAQNFLQDMTRKVEMRNDIERKSEEVRRQQQESLRQQAEEYREKLRGYLRPELRD
jgi:hypothetical protein